MSNSGLDKVTICEDQLICGKRCETKKMITFRGIPSCITEDYSLLWKRYSSSQVLYMEHIIEDNLTIFSTTCDIDEGILIRIFLRKYIKMNKDNLVIMPVQDTMIHYEEIFEILGFLDNTFNYKEKKHLCDFVSKDKSLFKVKEMCKGEFFKNYFTMITKTWYNSFGI